MWSGSVSSKFLVLAVLVLATGCGRKQLEVAGFESYVDAFQASSNAHGRNITVEELIIQFGTTASANADATCYRGGSETPKIVVDPNRWEQMPEEQRTALLFHEMGHCVLNREHKSGPMDSGGCPGSVMNPYTLSATCFSGHRDHYEEELFTGA